MVSRIHKRRSDVTILKNAFPEEFRKEFMALFDMPQEDKNQKTWVDSYDRDKSFYGPTLTDTAVGKRYRKYLFDKFKDDFDLILDSTHPNYLSAALPRKDGKDVYWGDFLLEFLPGKKLRDHRDDQAQENELRFNALLQKPDRGGVYLIDGVSHEMEQGDVIVFSPKHTKHGTSIVQGGKSRILLSVSFLTKYLQEE
tara:strand:+ start:1252 stop:1842 length:591 start_codon:yes stop_codon:yes gene_type:complete